LGDLFNWENPYCAEAFMVTVSSILAFRNRC